MYNPTKQSTRQIGWKTANNIKTPLFSYQTTKTTLKIALTALLIALAVSFTLLLLKIATIDLCPLYYGINCLPNN